ncbi:hypothetical protein LPJ60_006298, partial [Coemansia sp. RSA 2675]
CLSIFSYSDFDVALNKVLKYLKPAAKAEEGAEAATLANKVLTLLTGISAMLMIQQVCEISEQLKVFGQFTMVASLFLACASESDPQQ